MKYGPHRLGGLFGGGGGGNSNAYTSPYLKDTEKNARTALSNRVGATYTALSPEEQAKRTQQANSDAYQNYLNSTSSGRVGGGGTMMNRINGGPIRPMSQEQFLATHSVKQPDMEGTWDFSNVGKAPTVASATSEFDFSPVDQSIAKFQAGPDYKPTPFSTSYSPTAYNKTTFDFGNADNINKQAELQYGLGAADINRANQSNLTKTREALGPRNFGALARAGEGSNRDALSQLTKMRTQLSSDALGQITNLGKEQQLAQAAENFKAAGFSDDQAKALADRQFQASQFNDQQQRALQDYLQSYAQNAGQMGLNRETLKSDILQKARDYQDQGLGMYSDYLYKMAGLQNQTENEKMADKTKRQGSALQFLGNLVPG